MQQTYDVGRFEHVLDQALPLADWSGFEARAAESKKRGRWRGLGIATFLEWTGGSAFEESVTVEIKAPTLRAGASALPPEGALAARGGPSPLEADGVIEVFSAVNQMGQGIATSLAQLVVDTFQVPIDRVRVVLGDTDRGNGFGSAGSRSLFTGGTALHMGAEHTLEHAKKLAAQALEAAPEDLRYAAGRFAIVGTDRGIGLFELAARQPERHIFVAHTHTVAGPTWPNAAHVSEVEIDPETGVIQLVAYASVSDVGRVVSPTIVRGQIEGGAVQGIGQAFMERVVYDDAGQLLTGSLMDYTAPRADDIRAVFKTELDQSTPSKNNELGVKGVGELGTIGAAPCVVNAVADALARAGRPDLAGRVQMPITPARLWGLLNGV
jgi:carbon-monoxide dehydrogenase large subunit